jgi:predicted HTH domain antitoxin
MLRNAILKTWVMLELPDDVAHHANPGREILEAFAVEAYRSRELTQFQIGRLLGLSRIQAEDFLSRHVDLYDYSREDLESEADLLQRLSGG